MGYISTFKISTLLFFSGIYANSDAEAFHLSRIADFWEEGDLLTSKNQMIEFLKMYPNSSHRSSVLSSLGSLYLKEKNYTEALELFSQIEDLEIQKKIFPHKLKCLYMKEWYTLLESECKTQLTNEESPSLEVLLYHSISLYHQCLNEPNNTEFLKAKANEAEPNLKALYESPYKSKILPIYAQMMGFLDQFEKSADLFLELGESEEMLFQAALMQEKYNKEKAISTLEKLIHSTQDSKLKKKAEYNRLTALFSLEKHKEILQNKEHFLNATSEAEKDRILHIFAKSHIALGEIDQGIGELQVALEEKTLPEETKTEVAKALSDLAFKFKKIEALDSVMPFLKKDKEAQVHAKFYKALILNEKKHFLEAKEELLSLYQIESPLKADILRELIFTCDQIKHFEDSFYFSKTFLSLFPSHKDTPLIMNSFVSSSMELSKNDPNKTKDLLKTLENLIQTPSFEKKQKTHWKLIKIKTEIALSHFESAKNSSLELLMTEDLPMKEKVKAQFLLAIAIGNLEDIEAFCREGETALLLLQDFKGEMKGLDLATLHASLYNAYLELSQKNPNLIEKAKEHLFLAFEKGAFLRSDSLLWLASSKVEENLSKAVRILEHLVFEKTTLKVDEKEEAILLLAKAYLKDNLSDKAIDLLETANSHGLRGKEVSFLLAKIYQEKGNEKKALELFERVQPENGIVKTEIDAKISLEKLKIEKALLKKAPIESPEYQKVLVGLKNLILQKKLMHEPVYFEASLEYLDLFEKEGISLEKKKTLIEKVKRDFLSEEGILARDYHEERKKNPEKNQLFQSFLSFLDAKLLEVEGNFVESEKLKTQLSEASFLKERIQNPSCE